MVDGQHVSRDTFEGRVKLEDERFARDKGRLDKHEDDLDKVEKLTVQMGEMIKRHDERIDSHETRISSLERQPGDTWGKLQIALLSCVGTGIVAFILDRALG